MKKIAATPNPAGGSVRAFATSRVTTRLVAGAKVAAAFDHEEMPIFRHSPEEGMYDVPGRKKE